MSSFIGIDTAIGWAHWKVRGGWKNALWTTGVYAGVMVMILLLTVRMNPRNTTNILAGWRMGLLFLEGGLMVLLAGTRVGAAVRLDITSRMIESHRLMPISPWVAMTGYLWGPTLQSLVLAAGTFMMGLVVVMAAGMPPGMWIVPSGIMLTFAVFFWVVMAFLASIVRAPGGVVVLAVFISVITQGAPLYLLPGTVPILTPLVHGAIFQAGMGSADLTWQTLVGMSAQAWIGAALYIGAGRKYRRSEDSALAILPGLMLLAGWVGVSAVGLARWDDFVPPNLRRSDAFQMMLMGSLWSAFLLALVPISNAAQMRRPAYRMPIVALGCAAIIWPLALVFMTEIEQPNRALATTGAAAVTLLLSAGYILQIAYRFGSRGWVPLLLWIVLIGTGPVITDSILWGLGDVNTDYALSSIASISPGGVLVMVWTDAKASVVPGIAIQAALTIAWVALYHLTQRRAIPRNAIEPSGCL